MSPLTIVPAQRQWRVLVVEDEPMIAFALEQMLIDEGFAIAGVAGDLQAALTIIESDVCEVAILDANLAGVNSGPAAVALAARSVPFIVLSGYSPDQYGSELFGDAPRLQKPCQEDRIIQALRGILPAS
jgi:DNA-binding response OmpR family regulator